MKRISVEKEKGLRTRYENTSYSCSRYTFGSGKYGMYHLFSKNKCFKNIIQFIVNVELIFIRNNNLIKRTLKIYFKYIYYLWEKII